MTEQTAAPAEDWTTRVATARAMLTNLIEAVHLDDSIAALQQFFDQAEQLAEETVDDEALRNRLAALLTGTANGLRGAPAPLASHGWSDLPERAEAARAEIADLHYKLAAASLSAEQGWARYTSANADRNTARAALADLAAENRAQLEELDDLSARCASYERLLTGVAIAIKGPAPVPPLCHTWSDLPEAARARIDGLEAHVKAIREHTSGFACWWGMTEAQDQLLGVPIPDSATILHFMGSGASTAVQAYEIRRMLNTIYGMKGMAA